MGHELLTEVSRQAESRPYRDQDLPEQQFWAALSQSGLRVAVADVPKCPLTTGLKGIQIADWQVHGRDHPQTCSWPPELSETLLRRYGDDRTDRVGTDCLCLLHSLPKEKFGAFRSHLLDGLEKKTLFASELLEKENWGLVLVAFKEAHCVGHQCWHLMESDGDAARQGLCSNSVKDIYRVVETPSARLRDELGRKCP